MDLDSCSYSVAVFCGTVCIRGIATRSIALTSPGPISYPDRRPSPIHYRRRRFVFYWCSGCGTEFTYTPDCASTGITSLSHGNSGKRSLWSSLASRIRNRFCSTILQERTTGEGNSLQDRSEAKVEHEYHNTESLRWTDEVLRFGIRK
jgi:hypothetical protein